MSEEKENRVEERQGGESYQLHVLTKKIADEMRGKTGEERQRRADTKSSNPLPVVFVCIFTYSLS